MVIDVHHVGVLCEQVHEVAEKTNSEASLCNILMLMLYSVYNYNHI